jgi:hypothetical protein
MSRALIRLVIVIAHHEFARCDRNHRSVVIDRCRKKLRLAGLRFAWLPLSVVV